MSAEFGNKNDSLQRAKAALDDPNFTVEYILNGSMPRSGGRPAEGTPQDRVGESRQILKAELGLTEIKTPSPDQQREFYGLQENFDFLYANVRAHFDVTHSGPFLSRDGEVSMIVDVTTRDPLHHSVIPDISRVFPSPAEEEEERGGGANDRKGKKKLLSATDNATPEFPEFDEGSRTAPTLPRHEIVEGGVVRLLVSQSTQEGESLHVKVHAPSDAVREELARHAVELVAAPDSSRSSCVLGEIIRQTSKIVNERSPLYGALEPHTVEMLDLERRGDTTHLIETVPVALDGEGPLILRFRLSRGPGAVLSISPAR